MIEGVRQPSPISPASACIFGAVAATYTGGTSRGVSASSASAGTEALQVSPSYSNAAPAEDAADDRDRVAHRAERLLRLHPGVVQEDLRRSEAEQEAPRPGGLLDDARVHRRLHRVARERRDDPPADGDPLGALGDQGGDDRRGARLHAVLAPPRIGLGEPDRVHADAVHDLRRREHLRERLHRQLHDADAERLGHRVSEPRGRLARPWPRRGRRARSAPARPAG